MEVLKLEPGKITHQDDISTGEIIIASISNSIPSEIEVMDGLRGYLTEVISLSKEGGFIILEDEQIYVLKVASLTEDSITLSSVPDENGESRFFKVGTIDIDV